MAKSNVQFTKDNEYYTPKEFVARFGEFDYDPATTEEKAREFGIQSYDTIENHEQRLQVILDLIDTVDNMPIDKLKEMYEDMLPIIEHNYGILQGYTR